jgi:hypothetical protein
VKIAITDREEVLNVTKILEYHSNGVVHSSSAYVPSTARHRLGYSPGGDVKPPEHLATGPRSQPPCLVVLYRSGVRRRRRGAAQRIERPEQPPSRRSSLTTSTGTEEKPDGPVITGHGLCARRHPAHRV